MDCIKKIALTIVMLASTASFAQGLTICNGEFAMCAASTCKPTGKTITGNNGVAYPEVVCRCPILKGKNIADTAMGNMKGTCAPTDSDHVWSTFWPKMVYPQEASNFSHKPKDMKVVIQDCPASIQQGARASNCFSWNCKRGPDGIAICHCPSGQVPASTAFLTEAGQGDPKACYKHPVSLPYKPDGAK
jgi:hypothetical protein